MADIPAGNDAACRTDPGFAALFDATPIPAHVEGFECKDVDVMTEVWPEGTAKAKEVGTVFTVCFIGIMTHWSRGR
jgi:hypothetical protein